MPRSIEDYAVIGDSRSAALVSRDGAIDWLCWPRFDSPSLFAALLDAGRGGSWSIRPAGEYRATRAYQEETNLLETRFETRGGALRLTDFMPVAAEEEKRRLLLPEHELLRRVACERGEVEVELRYRPRPDYGRAAPRLSDAGAFGIRLSRGAELFTLLGEAPLSLGAGGEATARFTLRAGEVRRFSLSYAREGPAVLPPLGDRAEEALARSARFWRGFAARARYGGPYRAQVVRSALALKLLAFAPSGAIVAAPTTSLPERLGGDLNWDYRFCWLRDAAFTVRALLALGYREEAEAFVSWLLHTTRLTRPALEVLYDVYGGVPEGEEELPHLAGYRGSRPVRIRNGAAGQRQLDVYGEVLDAAAQLVRHGATLDRETQGLLLDIGRYVCERWREPDHGIWEERGALREYTHSRALCLVALERLLELSARGAVASAPRGRLEEQRAALRRDLMTRAFNPGLSSFTQTLGGAEVDASALLLGWYGILAPADPRMRSTYAAIEARLGAGPGLLYRNERSRSREGAFGICSFWAAEHLARGGGSGAAARRYFEQALGYANDVGLFAEEIDPATGAALGNFPQAFTHVGLISAALSLEERERSEARGAPGDRAKADDARRAPPPAHTPGAPPGAESQP